MDGPRVWGGTGCVSPSLRLWGCRWRGEAALVRRPAGSAPAAESGAVLPPDGESLNYTASSIPCPVPPGCWSPGAVAGRPAGEARTRQSVPSQQGAGTLAGPLRRCRPGKPMTWRQRLAWGHGPPRERRAAGAVLGQAAMAGGAVRALPAPRAHPAWCTALEGAHGPGSAHHRPVSQCAQCRGASHTTAGYLLDRGIRNPAMLEGLEEITFSS